MKSLKNHLKLLWWRILALVPLRLPIGMPQFEVWAYRIIAAHNLPDNDSLRFALATMIIHLSPQTVSKPGRYFAKTALKSMSNQIAGAVMQELKAKQAKEIKELEELEAKKKLESELHLVPPPDEKT